MTIIVANLSRQALINFGVTYTPSTGGGPTTYSMNLPARDLITNIGSVGSVPDSASSCISVTVITTSGPVTIPYGQTQPLPTPIGFNLLAGWAANQENVVITMVDIEGGMVE